MHCNLLYTILIGDIVLCFFFGLFLHLWLLELQVLSILYREVNVLQYYINTFLICAVKRQESHHTVVIDLGTQTERRSHQKINLIKFKCSIK